MFICTYDLVVLLSISLSFSRLEIESQISAIDRDIKLLYQQKQHSVTPNTSNPITPTTMENLGFHNGTHSSVYMNL